ncbi:MAG: hypothetical protein F6K58_15955 [Symploca sp. SIO2E9]|nr:hypothetical protein [Symploca sp. SIO2E9]
MSRGRKHSSPKNPAADIWWEFIAAEQKNNSKLGRIFAKATYGDYENRVLTLYFADEAASKAARGQIEPLKKKLNPQLFCDRINCPIGSGAPPPNPKGNSNREVKTNNPLQALNFTKLGLDKEGNQEFTQPVLQAAVEAESHCINIYDKLKQRTQQLVGETGETLTVSFDWRMRVGGTRGFRELLLPTLHPVFGIPHIPASSLKGVARAWAEKHHSNQDEVKELLGMLEGKVAKAAKIEILDAFPTEPCLSVDVATPQWHWRIQNQHQNVIYNPEPHPLLNLEKPQLFIGLRPTVPKYADKVSLVKQWLEKGLRTSGLGSRVSGGYGRTLGRESNLVHTQSFDFELWTQGMYGSNPPTKENNYQGDVEFRPTAIRGILRYWFRAVALGLYDQTTCLTLEEELFGNLGQQGKIAISTRVNPPTHQNPYLYSGKILLEVIEHKTEPKKAQKQKYLELVEQLLILASHLGGVGRGSRRPLHLLNERMRGCHWLVYRDRENLPLAYNKQQWQSLFNSVQDAFKAVEPSSKNYTSNPGTPKQRQQDALDRNTQVWLLKTPDLVKPKKVKTWESEGDSPNVRGAALNLLYGDSRFKGVSGKKGNANVGGSLGTPSFVWIKSIFPYEGSPYQVITIFGADDSQRGDFGTELKKQRAISVYPQRPSDNKPSRPRPRRR